MGRGHRSHVNFDNRFVGASGIDSGKDLTVFHIAPCRPIEGWDNTISLFEIAGLPICKQLATQRFSKSGDRAIALSVKGLRSAH